MLYFLTKKGNNLQNDKKIIEVEDGDGEYFLTQYSTIKKNGKHIIKVEEQYFS